jgi:hypothetical protein
VAAARFAQAWDDVRVCTFGSPRVGCPDFVKGYRPQLYRFERIDDLVCHLPPPPGLMEPALFALNNLLPTPVAWHTPANVRYFHAGELILLDADGLSQPELEVDEGFASLQQRFLPLLVGTLQPGTLLTGHQIDSYVASLKAATLGKSSRERTSSQPPPSTRRPPDMPGAAHISIDVTVVNRTERKLVRLDAVKNWGIYSVAPSGAIQPGESAQFQMQSNGFMTGADGCVTYQLQGVDGAVKLIVQAPYWHGNHFEGSAPAGFVIDYAGDLGGKHPSVTFTIKAA